MKCEIKGHDLQMVEITLDPNEVIKSQSGALLYMQDNIEMESKVLEGEGGFFSKIGKMMKRTISGESMALIYYTNTGNTEQKLAFSAEVAGKILPINLGKVKEVLCQPDAYLVSTPEVDIDFTITKISTGLFGGEGFILQKITGDGVVFLNAGGTIEKIDLNNETLKIDTGCLVAFHGDIDYSVEIVKGIKNIIFSGEGITLAKLSGTGSVYVQSMPFKRFAGKIYRALEPHFTKTNGENGFFILDSE